MEENKHAFFDEMNEYSPVDRERLVVVHPKTNNVSIGVDYSSEQDKTAECIVGVENLTKIFALARRVINENVKSAYESIIVEGPSSRILHLAKYHKSERVKKKNQKRILTWIYRVRK